MNKHARYTMKTVKCLILHNKLCLLNTIGKYFISCFSTPLTSTNSFNSVTQYLLILGILLTYSFPGIGSLKCNPIRSRYFGKGHAYTSLFEQTSKTIHEHFPVFIKTADFEFHPIPSTFVILAVSLNPVSRKSQCK